MLRKISQALAPSQSKKISIKVLTSGFASIVFLSFAEYSSLKSMFVTSIYTLE